MKRALTIILAAALAAGGAAVAWAQTTDQTTDGPSTEGTAGDESTAEETSRGGFEHPPVGTLLEGTLDDLVENGTLTRDQADAVLEALEVRQDTLRAERAAVREQLEEFWADGQLSEEELDQLPEGHPLDRLRSMMEDGVIDRDELGPLGRGHGRGPASGGLWD